MKKSIQKASLLLSASISILPFNAAAQNMPGAPAEITSEREAASSTDGQLADIVVTAQRRQESLQRVPLSITALGGDALQQRGITNSDQIAHVTPGLTLNSGGGFPQPFLRGVGSDRTANSEPSVATYIDGVYVALSAGSAQELYDIDRVEVLRGPQGTLYGRNATGGAINIITKRPSDKFLAQMSGTAGSHDLFSGNAYLSGPVGSTLAASVAFSSMRRDSFAKNISTRQQAGGVDHESALAGRAKLLWEPSEGFEAELSIDGTRTDSFDALAYRQLQTNATGFALGGITGSKPFEVAYALPVYNKVRQYGGSLRFLAELGAVNLQSLSGYRNTKQFPPVELSATDALVTRVFINPSRSEQYSQEVQLLSGSDSSFEWILGGYYFHEKSGNNPYFLTVTNILHQALDISSITDSYSAFAQVTAPVTDRLSVIGGLRHTWENKEVKDYTVTNLLLTPAVVRTFAGRKATFRKLTYRAGVNFQANPNTLLFASYSRGFKSGIFNLSNPADLGPVNPETLDAAEIGVKADLLDNRLRVNISAFHYDFKNLQVQSLAAGTGSVVLRNAASAKMNGGEIEITAAPSPRLQITSGLSFLDAKYEEFLGFPAFVQRPAPAFGNAAVPTDLSGRDLIRAPGFTASIGANYTVPLNKGELRLNGFFFHTDGYNFEPSGRARQSAYQLVNASVTYIPDSRAWELSIWGKNLTDERYFRSRLLTGLGDAAIYGDPVTGGATLTLRFGAAR